MGVGHLGGHVEPEFLVVVNVGVSEADEGAATRHKRLLQQDGLQSRVHSLLQLLTHNQDTKRTSRWSVLPFFLFQVNSLRSLC